MKSKSSSTLRGLPTDSTLVTSAGSLLSMYSLATPPELFDIRCEYEVPRYVDFNALGDDDDYELCSGGGGSTGLPDGNWGQHSQERKQSTTGGARPYLQ
jgi:hypothetical protein